MRYAPRTHAFVRLAAVGGVMLATSVPAASCSTPSQNDTIGASEVASPDGNTNAMSGAGAPATMPMDGAARATSGGATSPVQTMMGSGGATGDAAGAPSATVTATPTAGSSSAPVATAGTGSEATMARAGAESPPVECTPAEAWSNPGNVELPTVTPVPEGSGKGVPFGHYKKLEENQYVESEFFFSGQSPMFTSRFISLRPKDPARFSGTVFVEWYNVSGGMDVPVMWSASQEYFLRSGHAYIGVSAQQVGANALRDVDSDRYESISHPGDTASNAIFSRAGAALRAQTELVLGPCMKPRVVVAVGQSQSSARLTDYIRNTQAADQVYDGIMLHSGGSPATNDPPVPTLVIKTMNEGNGSLGDGPNMVEWAIAGASHNDKRLTENSFEIIGEAAGFDENPIMCANPMNDYPAYRLYNSALDWLARWARDGERPPMGMPFEMSGGSLAWDEHMNVRGGVRLPDIDVPIKSYTNSNGPSSALDVIGLLGCGLAGSAVPFSPEKLMQLYPTHEDYVQQYTAAADRALMAGFLLEEDYDEMFQLADAAPIPK